MTVRSRGISRIELIVAIAVVGGAFSLLIPAIQAARERARCYQCRSHLARLGTALHSYHDRYSVLPPAATWGSEGLNLAQLSSHRDPTPVHVTRQNWIQLLLPDLNLAALSNGFSPDKPVAHADNRNARMTMVPSLSCPADDYNNCSNFYQMRLPDHSCAEFARGNYAINGGSDYVPAASGNLSNPGPAHSQYSFDETTRQFQFLGNGIAGINCCLSIGNCRNGQATLVAAEEVRSGLSPLDTRGVWALGQIGASITWGHGVIGDDGAPNANERGIGADDIRHGPELYEELGSELIFKERMQLCQRCDENNQATARSKHPGGVYVLMLDGAVRFVSDNVEPTVWHVMHSRASPANLLADKFAEEVGSNDDMPQTVGTKAGSQGEPETTNLPQMVVNSLKMTFARIRAGEFTMGLPDASCGTRYPPDAVPHRVRMTRDFFIGTCEVTQRQFAAVSGFNPSWHAPTGDGAVVVGTSTRTDEWPVENVSWYEASKFCRLLSEMPDEVAAHRIYRLPTEAEWEYACRGGQVGPIVNPTWEVAEYTGEIASKKVPADLVLLPKAVGSCPPNAFGLYDMCGNVFEWTADYRRRGYYEASPVDDPQGPATGYLRVIRGWHWVATGPACKVYVANEPWTGSKFIGFRVVCMQGDTGAGAP